MIGTDYSRQGHGVETIQVFDILTADLWNMASCSRVVGTDVSEELSASII